MMGSVWRGEGGGGLGVSPNSNPHLPRHTFAYKYTVQSAQSRVRSCLQPSVKTQSVQLRTKSDSHEAATRMRQRTARSMVTASDQSQRRMVTSWQSSMANGCPPMSPGALEKTSSPGLPPAPAPRVPRLPR